jgi:hypothetical protein
MEAAELELPLDDDTDLAAPAGELGDLALDALGFHGCSSCGFDKMLKYSLQSLSK